METKEFFYKLKKYDVAEVIKVGCSACLFVLLVILSVQGGKRWYLSLSFSIVLFAVFEINSFFIKKLVIKAVFYSVEYVILLVYSLLFSMPFLSTLYSLILVDFYMNNSLKANCVFGGFSFLAYAVSISVRDYVLNREEFVLSAAFAAVINEFIVFSLVFTIANMLCVILKKNKEVVKNLQEVAEREKKLQEANENLKEMAKLEERNRIAKQIHDTTGHSITTIIMQTEAAKLKFDTDPVEAKNKIISANMQAVTALEELRKSVRVLSGEYVPFNLISSLDKAIAETMEGTDIVIRAKYPEEADVDEEIGFFIYASLKEGLNNGIRHGRATAFFFELKIVDGEVKFILSDNGTGAEYFKEGYGLSTMRATAEKFGGEASFYTEKDEGMEISLTLPAHLKKGEKHD